MNTAKVFWLVICLMSYALLGMNDFVSVTNFSDVRAAIADITRDDLVVIDVDEVLIHTPTRLGDLTSLIDAEAPIFLASIKELGCNAIALTGMHTGPASRFPNMVSRDFSLDTLCEDWRINHLMSLGIDFWHNELLENDCSRDHTIPLLPLLLNKQGALCSTPALCKGGVVFSAKYPKGNVLLAFVPLLRKKPRRIVFIDDDIRNLCSVNEFFRSQGIAFCGLLFKKKSGFSTEE